MARNLHFVKGILLFFEILLLGSPLVLANETTVDPGTASVPEVGDSASSGSQGREELARLMAHIKDLPVAKGKVPPLVPDSTGKQTVTLTASVAVFSVLGVDDVQQTVKSCGLLVLHWRDEALAWNVSDYGGITYVELMADHMWLPSVHVANSMNSHNLLDESGLVMIVMYDGSVLVRTVYITETLCDLDLTHYPFDQQACPLVFVSHSKYITWAVSTQVLSSAVADTFAIGSEWEVLSFQSMAVLIEEYNEGSAVVSVRMERKTTFYTVCLILPMVVTSYMNTLVFLLPLQSGEKISFLVSIYVSTLVFVSYFTSVMPRGLNALPNTMMLLIGVIVESFIVLLGTIIVLRRFHYQTAPDRRGDTSSTATSGDPQKRSSREETPQEETIPSGICCRGGSRGQTIRVAPAPELKVLEDKQQDVQSTVEVDRKRPTPTAERLDHVFFVLTFVGNTVFLATILCQTVSS